MPGLFARLLYPSPNTLFTLSSATSHLASARFATGTYGYIDVTTFQYPSTMYMYADLRLNDELVGFSSGGPFDIDNDPPSLMVCGLQWTLRPPS
jgi:hypothetical protein